MSSVPPQNLGISRIHKSFQVSKLSSYFLYTGYLTNGTLALQLLWWAIFLYVPFTHSIKEKCDLHSLLINWKLLEDKSRTLIFYIKNYRNFKKIQLNKINFMLQKIKTKNQTCLWSTFFCSIYYLIYYFLNLSSEKLTKSI